MKRDSKLKLRRHRAGDVGWVISRHGALVEPAARGRGVGTRLVSACVAFARRAGYRKVKSRRHREFGIALLGEYWELPLATPARRRRGT